MKKALTQSTEEFKYKKHHKDTLAFPLMFVGDVKSALKVFIVNPFDTKDFTMSIIKQSFLIKRIVKLSKIFLILEKNISKTLE